MSFRIQELQETVNTRRKLAEAGFFMILHNLVYFKC